MASWLEEKAKQRYENVKDSCSRLNAEALLLKKQEDELIESITRCRVESVQRTLESRIEAIFRSQNLLEARRKELEGEHVGLNGSGSAENVRTLIEEIRVLVKNPLLLWKTGDVKQRQLVARVVFPKAVIYDRNTGLRTPEYALCYRIFNMLRTGDSTLVDPGSIGSNFESVEQIIEELLHWRELSRSLVASREHDRERVRQGGEDRPKAVLVPPL